MILHYLAGHGFLKVSEAHKDRQAFYLFLAFLLDGYRMMSAVRRAKEQTGKNRSCLTGL